MAVFAPSNSEDSDFSTHMKLLYFSNEFPHDDLQTVFDELHTHSKNRRHHILARFLDEATIALRDEIKQLPTALKALIPPFETISNLINYPDLRKGQLCGSIDGILLCTVQIGTLIGYVEMAYSEDFYLIMTSYFEQNPDAFHLDGGSIALAGLGIGLLATAAVSLAPTVSDLPITGAQVVRQAFRLGVVVDEVSQNLQPRDFSNTGTPDSWAYVLPNVSPDDVQQELDSIHAKEVNKPCLLVIRSLISGAEDSQSQQSVHKRPERNISHDQRTSFSTESFASDSTFLPWAQIHRTACIWRSMPC
jgi:hypothetical protein